MYPNIILRAAWFWNNDTSASVRVCTCVPEYRMKTSTVLVKEDNHNVSGQGNQCRCFKDTDVNDIKAKEGNPKGR